MFLTFVGAAGSTSQALRSLDGATVGACSDRAAAELATSYLVPGEPRFAGPDTIRFAATDPDGLDVTVTCRLGEPDVDTDGALPVRTVEVER